MSFTIGSLFDGSGGFPLAGFLSGGIPVWASEIEPYPIAVTKSRFPYVKHLGSVTDIKGDEIDPVDVITFGSPCQDLSVAGKRAGLKHEDNGDDETTRSGLFMEAVRIIKEMREATNGEYPRFALWENVPGAFSSNKGEDFKIVLEELIKVVEPSAVMPDVPQKGWTYADSYRGNGWSIAYRVFDAQYWGVAQRRRRIYLVADFRGECAGEVLFKRQGLRGYSSQSRTPWEGTSGNVTSGIGTADSERECVGLDAYNQALTGDKSKTLNSAATDSDHIPCVITSGCKSECVGFDSYNLCETGDVGRTIAGARADAEHIPCVYYPENDCVGFDSYNLCETGNVGRTVTTPSGGLNEHIPCVYYPVNNRVKNLNRDDVQRKSILDPSGITPPLYAGECRYGGGECYVLQDLKVYESHPMSSHIKELKDNISPTVTAKWHKGAADTPLVCETIAIDKESFNSGTEFDRKPGISEDGICSTLRVGGGQHAVCYGVCYDARGNGDGLICPTITGDHNNRVTDYTSLVVEPTYCLEGNGSRPSHLGDGWKETETMYTLNATEHHSVCTPIALDRAFFNQGQNAAYPPQLFEDGTNPTLVARGPNAVCVQYVVRRITPTECARLQGFPDCWGHPDKKDDFTDEEYEFWLKVRNTHAEINGKTVKDYPKKSMLTWYNKLHTDSSEYKLWGNGIALPNALYVMQGISDVYTSV